MGKQSQNDPLADALSRWRQQTAEQNQAEGLSTTARAEIFRVVLEGATPGRVRRHLRSLFLPGARIALASAVPVALVVGILGFEGADPMPVGDIAQQAPPKISVLKENGEVVFIIANGTTGHRVTRTSADDPTSASAVTTTDGTYRDGLTGGPDLVFYRIE